MMCLCSLTKMCGARDYENKTIQKWFVYNLFQNLIKYNCITVWNESDLRWDYNCKLCARVFFY